MFLRYNLFTILWLLLILLLTLSPGDAFPETRIWTDLLSFDKVVHFLIFSILVVLMIVSFSKQYASKWIRKNAVPLALAVSIGYGILIELIQILIPGRYLEIMDIVANTIGCIIGYGIFYLLYKF